MDAYFAKFPAQSPESETHEHKGAEVIYVMAGALVETISGQGVTLTEGDSLYFDCGYPPQLSQRERPTLHGDRRRAP
jgi:quercetin dioxygenase-like cupin family protein